MIFDDSISDFLINSIVSNKVSNAFLFHGGRGVGKTTIARIFSKSLNCGNIRNGFEPCNECLSCNAIKQDRHPDVMEIDAASNNGVDSVRDLIENSKYLPIQSRYKIYILDEVHMFSSSAFNALLKILEEPPAYVVFLLSTTELQKIPKTVLSRCKSLKLKSITSEDMYSRLNLICEKEQIKFDEKALHLISRCAKGSLRDAISLLDQVSILTDNKVSLIETQNIFGLGSDDLIADFSKSLLKRDSNQILDILKEMRTNSMSFALFFEQIIGFLSILMMRAANNNIGDEDFNMYLIEESNLQSIIECSNYHQLNALIEIFVNGYEILKKSSYLDEYSVFRLTVMRALMLDLDDSIDKKYTENKVLKRYESIKTAEDPRENMKSHSEIQLKTDVLSEEIKPKCEFGYDDMISMFDDLGMVKIIVDNKDCFDYENFIIRNSDSIPNRHLQMILRKLRETTKNKWKILMEDVEKDQAVIPKKLDVAIDHQKESYSDIKNEFFKKNSLIRKLSNEFRVGSEDVKVSK